MRKRRSVWAVALWAAPCLLVVCIALLAGVIRPVQGQGQAAPKYKLDPDWPKPLPNKWKLGGVTGLAVDNDDNVWVLNRPNDLTSIELEAELNPPIADCCVHPPAMIHFDKKGNVIGSFDAPQGHGMDVDNKGYVYIGQNTVRKYDPNTGKIVGEIAHTPETPDGRPFVTPTLSARTPGQGAAGPVAGFITVPNAEGRGRGGRGGRGNPEAAAEAAAQQAAFRKKYP